MSVLIPGEETWQEVGVVQKKCCLHDTEEPSQGKDRDLHWPEQSWENVQGLPCIVPEVLQLTGKAWEPCSGTSKNRACIGIKETDGTITIIILRLRDRVSHLDLLHALA